MPTDPTIEPTAKEEAISAFTRFIEARCEKCPDCHAANGCYCRTCTHSCGMKLMADGSVASCCCEGDLYRDRALTVPYEDHDALYEMRDDPRAVALEADYRRAERQHS